MATKKNQDIFADPRYPDFLDRYHADPMRFAIEVAGFYPSKDQEKLFNALVKPNAMVSVVSGTGCFAKGTKIMLSDGNPINVEDVKVGMRLMGPDGNSTRTVLELKGGKEKMYRFTYMDGSSHVFNESHILTLAPGARFIERGKPEIINITVKEWLNWNKTNKSRYYVYRSPVIKFERRQKKLEIPPYILGVWLGDGLAAKPSIVTQDVEVDRAFSEWIKELGAEVSIQEEKGHCWIVAARRNLGTEQSNPVTKKLREIGVYKNKHIPPEYQFASLEDRKELLAGLIDTDGYYDGCNLTFVQKDQKMAETVCWIARSIGCHATVKMTTKVCGNNGKKDNYWQVNISRNCHLIPLRVPRRKPIVKRQQRPNLIFGIKKVECLGEGEYYGFSLNGDHRFLAYDFTVLHNTGKTASFARIALWHLLCHPRAQYEGKTEIGSNTYIGAPFIKTVADGIWKELEDCRIAIGQGPQGWINEYYEITKTEVFVKGYQSQWFITQLAMPNGKSIGVAGKHRYWQMIIVDEAAGVSDDHYNVIGGTQTQPGNRTLLASQGVKNTGRFYDTHHSLAVKNGGSWVPLRFDSRRSPFVTNDWLKNLAIECGGTNTEEYKIRVKGEFAESSSHVLLRREEIESAFNHKQLIQPGEDFGYLVLADVAMGEYRDKSVAIVAKVIGNEDQGPNARRVEYIAIPYCANDKNEIDFAGDICEISRKYENSVLIVDAGGIGATVCKLMERSNPDIRLKKILWGNPCFKKEYKRRFYNQRACAMVRFRDAVKNGRVKMPENISLRLKNQIIDEAVRLPYKYSETGGMRYVMESKENMRKDGIHSPDLIDAMSFAFLEGSTYIPAGSNYGETGDLAENLLTESEDFFSDLLA